MRCVLYVMVLLDEQAKAGYSLDAQVDTIKSLITPRAGWPSKFTQLMDILPRIATDRTKRIT